MVTDSSENHVAVTGPPAKKARTKRYSSSGVPVSLPPEEDDVSGAYIMRMQSSQAMEFKALMDVLKDLLDEINIQFTPKGIKIVSIDRAKLSMIYISIYNLDRYRCESTFYCGQYTEDMYKDLRSVNTGHFTEWRIRRDAPDVLETLVVHPERRVSAENSLTSLDLVVEEVEIPDVEFDFVLSLPSGDLQAHIKNLNHVSKTVTVRISDSTLEFIANGERRRKVIKVLPTPGGMNWIHKDNNTATFEGMYFLKYLERFSKGQVDPTVEIYLRQGYPLVMRYRLTIGCLRFIIAPITVPVE